MMPASLPKCGIATIPSRLHARGRQKVPTIAQDDRMFIRHEPLSDGEGYGCRIPGHDNIEDQSANSEKLNAPHGFACDVLFDSKKGDHHLNYQFACLDVFRIHQLALPNQNTILYDRHGNIKKSADVYTFEVTHSPTECMYPHCEILAKKNGALIKRVSPGFKTAIRTKFADLAELNRSEMIERRAEEFPKWNKELKRRVWLASVAQKLANIFHFLRVRLRG
jgi:hypothetical protein